MNRLLQDKELADLIKNSQKWHRNKADELYTTGQDLWDAINNCRLTENERVAHTLTQDMQS